MACIKPAGLNYPSGILTNRIAITTQYVTVQSANNNPANTIIKGARATDGNTNGWGAGAVRGVYMTNNTKLIGFTITNCATLTTNESTNANDQLGGGVLCANAANCIISNCIVEGNVALASGGGINGGSVWNSQILNNISGGGGGGHGAGSIYNSTISGNKSLGLSWGPGGGLGNSPINVFDCMVVSNTSLLGVGVGGVGANYTTRMKNTKIIGNTTTGTGGGMHDSGSSGKNYAENCLIAGNSASGNGGGVMSGAATNTGGCSLKNCTVVGNSASGTGGGVYSRNGAGQLDNCVSWGNNKNDDFTTEPTYYSCGAGVLYTNTANGNTTNTPLFVNAGSGTGTGHVMGDYHLQANSPCVNTGTNGTWTTSNVDLDGRARIRYGTVDMGCYELMYRGTIFSFR